MPTAHHGDVDIYYETFGRSTDPALLLINGLGSQCIHYRTEWCEMFAGEGFFVIRFDNRDVGLSAKFAGTEAAYTLGDMAGDALAVLDVLGVQRAHVMGLSMGGMIAQTLAIDHASRLLSLTSVMSTTGDPDVGRASPEALPLLLGPPATTRDGVIEQYLQAMRTFGSPDCYDEDRLRAMAGEAFDRSFSPDGQRRQMMTVMASPSRTAALGEVSLPALVMHGDKDRLVDISGGHRTADAIPGARFVVMEGMGHDYPPQYWERWVQLVTDHAREAADHTSER